MGFYLQCPEKTWRLVWIMGIMLAVIITLQYFEPSYSNNLSSISSALKNVAVGNASSLSDDESTKPVKSLNSSLAPEETNQSFSEETTASYKSTRPSDPVLTSESDSHVSATERELQKNVTTLHDNSTVITNIAPAKKKRPVVSISQMNNLLLESLSSNFTKPQWPSAVDQELLYIKAQIESSPIIFNDPALYPPLYKNLSMFKRSYGLMEDMLKVYVYREGERPILHQPFFEGIYASEGWFMKQLEDNKRFVTENPIEAHLFYLPFSSKILREELYVPNSHSKKNIIEYLQKYLDLISSKYPFWNRTQGTDHFLVACHDWAPAETRIHMANCIRALCNSNVNGGFVFGKDVSLPETYVRTPNNPVSDLGGKPPSERSILAFFAGSVHGYLRAILLHHWENKDPDMKIFGPNVRHTLNYVEYMKSSKYCICARGSEVNSARVVESIMYECVPVIISDNYVPPFLEVLNWESFAVFVPEKEIPELKNILLSISKRRYLSMKKRVKRVQQHFLWHSIPVKYDIFHMILHSIWYNRVFQMRLLSA